MVAGIAVMTGYFYDLLLLFLIVFIHEMGHALAALHYKWKIKKIELLPFGGVMETTESGGRPLKEELVVAIAGPMTHLPLMFISYLLLPMDFWELDVHQLFIHYNMTLLLFNLLPIWPLDGGKMLLCLYSFRLPFYKAQKMMWKTSSVCLIVCTVTFLTLFPYHLHAWFLFLFFLVAHYTEWRQQPYRFFRFLLEREQRQNNSMKVTTKWETISDKESPMEAAKKMRINQKHQFFVKENGQTIPESYILEAIISKGTGMIPMKEQFPSFPKK